MVRPELAAGVRQRAGSSMRRAGPGFSVLERGSYARLSRRIRTSASASIQSCTSCPGWKPRALAL